MSEQDEKQPDVLALLAALVGGDRWLSADGAAAYMGQMPRKTYLQTASKPGFPAAVWIGKRRVWRKSELDTWAEAERAKQQRRKAA